MLTANFRSLSLIGLQIGSPSMFTRTAGVWLEKIGGGSAFTPSTFFGMIWLLSMAASTRSRAMTRSCGGTEVVTSAMTVRSCSFGSVEKFASTTRYLEKSTRRSATETDVSASICSVPSAGFVAPFGVYEAAA